MKREIDTIEQIQATAELAPCGIGLFCIDTASPVFLNQAYYDLVGYTPQEYRALVKDNDMLMYPQDVEISHQSKALFTASGETNNREYRIVRKDGELRWVKMNATTIEIQGRPYAYTVFTDITREKEAYAQLTMIAENTNSSISVIQVSAEGEKLVYANSYFFQMTGVNREAYEKNMQAVDASLVSAADRMRLQEAAMEAFACEQTREIEYQLIRPDGKRLWVSRRFRVIRQDDGKSYALVSVVTDITQRKETEITLALQQQRFQMVIRELGAAVFEWNLQTGSFYSSDAYQSYAISAVNPKDILNNCGPKELVHPDDQPLLQQFFRDADAGHERVETTLRLKMTDGSFRWCHMIGFFYRGENGLPTRTIGVLIDVNTEHEHSFILDNILNAMPGGVGIFGFGKTITCEYFSDGFARMGGYTRAQIEAVLSSGKVLEAFIAPMDFAKISRIMADSTAKGLPLNLNYRFLHQDRSVHWLHLSAAKMRDIDGVPYYYCIFTNPSEETAMYRSIVEDSAIGVFVGERAARTTLYTNRAIREICGYAPDAVLEGRTVMDIRAELGELPILTREQIANLSVDTYTVFRVALKQRYLSIRAKAISWNDVDAYILYVADETVEHENQQRLQKLVDEVPGGIGIYEIVDGRVKLTYLNNAYYEMLGMTRESRQQYFGDNAMQAAYREDVPVLKAKIQEMIDGKDRVSILHRVRNGQGKWVWLNMEASVVEREGQRLRVYASFSNCDELIRSQEALRTRYEDQVRFAQMVASNAVASSMVNLTRQTISMQSSQADGIMEIITRRTPQQGFEAMYPCIPDEEIRKAYAEIFNADRIAADFAKGIEHKGIRHPYMNYECWYESTYNAVRNPKTNDLEVYCVARDVSKDVQDEFVNRRIMSNAYDEVLLLDPVTGEPQIIVENVQSGVFAEQKRLGDYNLGLKQFLMKHCLDEHPEQTAEALNLRVVISALQRQQSYTVSYSLMNQDNQPVRRTATFSYLNKYKLKLLCVIQDITAAFEKETQQRDALKAALKEVQSTSRAKADFYSRMSHDMRTPMNGILGMAELSKDEMDVGKLRANIRKIHESGEYLLNLINDTLDVQRIESGKLVIEPRIVSTKDVVESILDMIRANAAAKGVKLNYSAGNADLNWYIRADALRLKQIFINLLSNAVKFTPAGGTVSLEFGLLSREGMISHDVIYVRDTGIGMSEAFLKDGIFQPFSQESSAVSAMYAGSGLGLSIAKRLVELMNGRIEVKSQLGVGTTFTVYLDFERVNDAEAAASVLHQQDSLGEVTEVLRGKRILLAEDHPLNAEIAQKLLGKAGCETIWVKNGQEAVDRFVREPEHTFDAVLMDIRMPVMDGLEAARQLRALHKADAADIPIIAMTANTYEDDIRAVKEAGMNAHLGKPIMTKELFDKLAAFLADKKEK